MVQHERKSQRATAPEGQAEAPAANPKVPEGGWGSQRRVSKFIAYFQLLEACDKPGCPVCRCLRELTFRSLDGLLYEGVTDPGTRAVFTKSWGFCSWHAWMATEVRNAALGMAILYQDLLSQLHARLSAAHRELSRLSSAGGWRRLFRRRAPVGLVQARARRTGCPLCSGLGDAELRYLRTVLDYIGDPEFDRGYARSVGLCLPHLILALAHFSGHGGAAPLLARTL